MFKTRQSTNILDKRVNQQNQIENNPFSGAIGSKMHYANPGGKGEKQDRITPAQAKTFNNNPFNKAVVDMKQGIERQHAVTKYAEKRAVGAGIGNLNDRKDQRKRSSWDYTTRRPDGKLHRTPSTQN